MTAQELAERLVGMTSDNDPPAILIEAAKQSGLIIVYGGSDDLMEFRGAIHDEYGVNDGGEVTVTPLGVLEDFDEIDSDDKDKLREYFKREAVGGQVIEALWAQESTEKGDYSWTYRTNIPHSTFEITDAGEEEPDYPYCRGIVFALADVQPLKIT